MSKKDSKIKIQRQKEIKLKICRKIWIKKLKKQNILPWHCTLGLTRQLQQQIGKQLQTVSQNAEASADPGKPSWKYISIFVYNLTEENTENSQIAIKLKPFYSRNTGVFN